MTIELSIKNCYLKLATYVNVPTNKITRLILIINLSSYSHTKIQYCTNNIKKQVICYTVNKPPTYGDIGKRRSLKGLRYKII